MAEPLKATKAWAELEAHHQEAKAWHMRTMFEEDPNRFRKFRQVFQ